MLRCPVPSLLVVLTAILTVCPNGSAGSAEPPVRTPVTVGDLLRMRTIREVVIDPEARFAIVSIESFDSKDDPNAELEERRRPGDHDIRRHLHRVDLQDRSPSLIPLTFGERRDGSPRISPDGSRLAFIRQAASGDENDEKSQVWVLPLNGGGEAKPITRFEHGASRAEWSPDGRHLLVETRWNLNDLIEAEGPPVWDGGRPGRVASEEGIEPDPDGTVEEVRAWLDANTDDRTPKLVNRLSHLGERAVEETWRPRQLMLVDREGEEEPIRLGKGVVDRRAGVFTVDGRSVVLVTTGGEQHPDLTLDSRLEIIDLETPDVARPLFDEDGWRVSDPQSGPDGSLIAFVAQRTDEPAYRGRQIGLVPASGGEPIWATSGEWTSVSSYRWGHEPATVLFTARRHGGVPFFTASPATLQPIESNRLREGLPAQVHDFDVGRNATIWIESSAGAPSTLRLLDETGERLVFDPNPWIATREIARPTEDWITRPDGSRVQSWLLPPLGLEPGETAPLILAIHGGPMSMWGPAEPTMWLEWQLAAAWGYGVVYANPRGSSGYGERFQRGNHQNWGAGPAGDCLAALDAATERAWVDPDRLVVTGGSYGGYLTAWIIAHDQRFKAAVAQRGVYDLATFFGEGNAYQLVEWAFGGHPHDPRFAAMLDRESPVRHAARIETPLLVLHGEEDRRTGVSQSGMLFRALKVQGRPVEYVLYPGAGHDLSRSGDPVTRMDRLVRILEFFTRFAPPDEIRLPSAASEVTSEVGLEKGI